MIGSSQNSDLEARFAHLLQPIRDLTRNWDVNIANYLEEYLEDLENVVITFNNGQTTMNFAEAAMLIQGSTCVYSKKVEYLYSLVYQVLDMIVNKKKQQKSSVDAEGNDADVDFPEDDKEEFLSLDDTKRAESKKLQSQDNPDKESHVHPQTPMNLIAQEDGEKEVGEINNHKGELLGCVSDFQMNCSSVQAQGGVFLDSNLLPLLNSHLRLLASSTPFPHRHRPELEKSGNAGESMDLPPPPPMDDISMDGGGDGGFEPLDDHDGPPAENLPQGVAAPDGEEPAARRSERKRVQFALPKPEVDHWALKDSFSKSRLGDRKLRKGTTFRVPKGADHTAAKKRKRKTIQEQKEQDLPISQFVEARVYSNKAKFPKNPSLVPSFPELEDLFWKEFKRRQEEKRERLKLEKEKMRQEELEALDTDVDDLVDNVPAVPDEGIDVLAVLTGGDGDDDEGGNFEPFQLQLDDNALGPIEACGGDFINSLGSTSTTYEDIVRQHIENFLAQAAKYAQTTELSKRVSEWEEKITPKLLEEEQREAFDIHKYGSRVIDSLQRNEVIPFRRVVTGKPLFQICRLFLATLQLANTYNIEISCPGKLADGMDKMALRLLSTKRHYEELAEYQAPSLATNTQ